MADLTLRLENISFTYRNGNTAINNVNLELGQGVVGLLGANGAGKTTLMSMISTLTRPTSGRITWCGTDTGLHPNSLREQLGYLPQHFGIYPSLSAREFLSYLAAAKGIPSKLATSRIGHALEVVGLSDVGDQRLGSFSGGMRQRVGIAQTLLNDPKLIIVDEPTAGLDPTERMRFRLLLSELALGRLVILSTHIVSDIAEASSIAVLAKGNLLFHGSTSEMEERAKARVWQWTIPESDLEAVRSTCTISSATRIQQGVCVRAISSTSPAVDASHVAPTLEDAYLSLVNE